MVRPVSSSSWSSTGTKKTKKVDSGKPKRPLTAYNIFFKEQRQRILAESNGSSGGFAELARNIASRWKKIDPIDHKICCQKAVEDKQRYQQEMMEWMSKAIVKRPVVSNCRAAQDRVSKTTKDTSTIHFKSTRSISPSQQLFTDRRSSSAESVLSRSEGVSRSAKSLEDLISRPAQLLARDMLCRRVEQQEAPTPVENLSGLGVCTNDNFAPLPVDQTQSPHTHRGLERVFDEVWLESECTTFDLDDATSSLLSRMLEC